MKCIFFPSKKKKKMEKELYITTLSIRGRWAKPTSILCYSVQRANKGERKWGEAQPIYGRQPSKAELWVKHLQLVPTKRREELKN